MPPIDPIPDQLKCPAELSLPTAKQYVLAKNSSSSLRLQINRNHWPDVKKPRTYYNYLPVYRLFDAVTMPPIFVLKDVPFQLRNPLHHDPGYQL